MTSEAEIRDAAAASPAAAADPLAGAPPKTTRRRRHVWRSLIVTLLVLALALVIARLCMPYTVRWYVNRALNQSPLYTGHIGRIDIHLYRGAYSIRDVRINKKTGNVPVPLFSAKRLDLALEWRSLLKGSVVAVVNIDQPELNFVDAADDQGGGTDGDAGGSGAGQSGAGGPWLAILADLFPFRINTVRVNDGSVHFRTFQGAMPVDVYLAQLNAAVENLTNIQTSSAPLFTTVQATALVMDQARFEYSMRLDPFSYKPTFHMATRVLNLECAKLNDLTRQYGGFDFEHGWLDLVIEVDAEEGLLEGYVKPLFRNLKILDIRKDAREGNPLEFFWEGIVGGAKNLLKNQPRDQFGTLIPFTGDVDAPQTDVVGTLMNVLRNAFVRAYLPRLQDGGERATTGLQFGAASPIESPIESPTESISPVGDAGEKQKPRRE